MTIIVTKDRLVPETIHGNGRLKLTAQITPRLGANLISFTANGRELLFWNPRALLAGKHWSGAFNMFPTPCRLANCSYTFEGRKIRQRKNGEDVFIHGLIRNESMECRNDGNAITSWIDIEPGHPVYEGFPFACRFSISHILDDSSLTVRFRVKNNDSRNLPFGYGIHPYWRIQGRRKDVLVRVPCDNTLDLTDLVPTGGYTSVDRTDLDLRALRSLERLNADNIFWPRKPGDTAEIVLKAARLKIDIAAGNNFKHMIVYSPTRRPFVCVENLTSSPNAPNLVTAGKGETATMLVVKPGKTEEGWVKYTVSRI